MEVFAALLVFMAALEIAARIPVPTSLWLPRDDYAGGGKIVGGTVTSKLPRRLSEKTMPDDAEFVEAINRESEIEFQADQGAHTARRANDHEQVEEILDAEEIEALERAQAIRERSAKRAAELRKYGVEIEYTNIPKKTGNHER